MTDLPDIKDIVEVIYRYKDKEFYLEGDQVKKFMQQIGSASMMTIIHGGSFESINWKGRKIK